MFFTLLRWTLIVALVVVVCAVGALVVHGPLGPLPGGPLFGEVVREPASDWSFTDAVGELQVETRWGFLPYSVTTWCLSHEGTLYLPASNGAKKRWTRLVSENPDVRLRIAGKVYEVRLVRISEPPAEGVLARATLAKYFGIEADEVRPKSGMLGEGIWMFRVEARDEG
jgi:hypothetical protein